MKIKKHITALSFAVLAVASAAAQSLPFTAVNYDPASLAKGGSATLTTSSVAYSSFENPAAVPFYDQNADFSAVYSMWNPNGVTSNVAGVAGAYNIKDKLGVSAGFSYGMHSAYEIYNSTGASEGNYTPSDIQFNIGLAYRFIPSLSVGVNVGYASSALAENVSYGSLTSDVFLMGDFNGFKAAIGVSDLGPGVVSTSGTRFSLPTSGVVALGYCTDFANNHGIDLEIDAEYYFKGGVAASFGAEYDFRNMLFARAGYRYGGNSVLPSFASIGAGVKFAGIKIDAAYLFANEVIGNTIAVSVGYSL